MRWCRGEINDVVEPKMLPLRKDEIGNVLPIKHKNIRRVCTPEELVFFFRHCFCSREKKFKIILLLQLGCECRIHEACAVNLDDFIKGSDFRELDMRIQKKAKWITKKDGSKKIIGNNVIERKVIPESIAAIVRSWISDNWTWILEFDGYIFPPSKMQKTGLYTKPEIVERWMTNKRKQLADQFPDKSFLEVIGKVIYKDVSNMKFKKNLVENRYLWRTHMMKVFAGTYAYKFTKDAVFVQNLLGHENLKVTEKHYIDGITIAPFERREKVKNSLFNINFYENIIDDKDKIVAVWDKLSKKKRKV